MTNISAISFKHFSKMNGDFLEFLDKVFGDLLPWVPFITSDWRPGDGPSLHNVGRAVDIRVPMQDSKMFGKIPDVTHAWKLMKAIVKYKGNYRVEFEIELSPGAPHYHIALYPAGDVRPSKLLLICNHKPVSS